MSNHSIQVTAIKCYNPSESNITDGDEVYLVCQADGGIPIRMPSGINESKNMKSGQQWNIKDLVLDFDYEVLVTLMDHDLNADPNLATYLQSYDFTSADNSDEIKLSNRNGAKYGIVFTKIK
jgi:hypothetical protein